MSQYSDDSAIEGARWPEHLRELCRRLQTPQDRTSHDDTCGEIWKILYFALSLYLRKHSAQIGRISREDREDLVSDKSLDLLQRIVSGSTDFSDRKAAEIASYLSRVARNDLLDFGRKSGRRVEPKDEDREEWDMLPASDEGGPPQADSPDLLVERREFAEAVRRCAETLESRSRLIWFFRIFYGMSTRDIARHPRVGLKIGHVDVLLQRSRGTMRECLGRRGFEAHDMPPGAFVEMWTACRPEAV